MDFGQKIFLWNFDFTSFFCLYCLNFFWPTVLYHSSFLTQQQTIVTLTYIYPKLLRSGLLSTPPQYSTYILHCSLLYYYPHVLFTYYCAAAAKTTLICPIKFKAKDMFFYWFIITYSMMIILGFCCFLVQWVIRLGPQQR